MTTKEERAVVNAFDLKSKLQKMVYKILNGEHIGTTKYTYVYPNDFADIIRYCDLVIKCDFKKAAKLQRDMDTPVYELLPNSLYNFIQEYY